MEETERHLKTERKTSTGFAWEHVLLFRTLSQNLLRFRRSSVAWYDLSKHLPISRSVLFASFPQNLVHDPKDEVLSGGSRSFAEIFWDEDSQ